MNAIEIHRLTKDFGNKRAVSGINLTVSAGSIFGFLGPNGAGKTTTIKMLIGLIKPTLGTATICGFDVVTQANQVAPIISAIVEMPTFFPHLTAIQTLKTLAEYSNVSLSSHRCEELLDRCGILNSSNVRVGTFSLGMKQRLGLAAALLNNPKVIFLDEPNNGLDPDGILEVRTLLKDLAKRENRTIFVSSHQLNEVELVCDEIAILKNGEVVSSSKVDDLQSKKSIYLNSIPIDETLKVIQTKFHNKNFSVQGDGLRLDLDKDEIPLLVEELVLNKISVYEIKFVSPTIEQYFHETLKNDKHAKTNTRGS
ncbi:MAG: ABC transporter ATP-binding protein [Pyrinomonadaceae bacterium]